MEQKAPVSDAAEKMAVALQKIETENRHLEGVVKAFRAILIEQARWKSELAGVAYEEAGPFEAEQFKNGFPRSERERLIRLGALWQTAASRLIPPLVIGFPKVRGDLERVQAAIMARDFDPDRFLSAVFGGREKEAQEIAEQIGLEAELLAFVLTQAGKPVVEKRAEILQPSIKGLTWDKGYCPICGSFPELSLLKEKEGQRWLRCSFCASAWRFHRSSCPACDAQGPDGLEIIFVEGREYERVEVCHQCKKYIPSIDLRTLVDEVALEAAGFALMPLEAIAQERGFLPMVGSRRNLLSGNGNGH